MMKTILFLLLIVLHPVVPSEPDQWIRVNRVGYQQHSVKTAVSVSVLPAESPASFDVCSGLTDATVLKSSNIKKYGGYGPFASTFRLDFSNLSAPGVYYIRWNGIRSPLFRIGDDVYNGSADVLLQYMRQQRSGYNPFLKDSCHTSDGFIIYHPELDSTHIDVAGGWHDASDYLQYVTTSATAVYQMLFAYQMHPEAFGDSYSASGDPGSNGIPDILDEAKWGLEWLLKMNPTQGMYFNQLADDRDHRGFRLPTEDTVFYGIEKQRPVYFIDGKPQGIYQHKNRTTGAASTVAKFASSFSLGSELLRTWYPEFSAVIRNKAVDAYTYAKQYPGVSQTAPCRAPYFYEEDNWSDDMELAAAQLAVTTADPSYLHDAAEYGRMEPVTPWMGADTARHYQWYPFVNLGHYRIASRSAGHRDEFVAALKAGIDRVYQKGKENAFLFGVPFIWCSNNLVSGLLTQIHLYRTLTNDTTYDRMEASLRDWLFGCNPWGTSMVVGFPAFADTPTDPHSAFSHVYGYPITGGLVDGPVRASIFDQHRKYIRLTKQDPYAPFQSDIAVYHDDWGDYTNNEPTMDGTAGLTMVLAALESNVPNKNVNTADRHRLQSHGAVTRFDTTKREIYLVFTGHEFADGGRTIADVLKVHRIPASFFFTGDFYRNKDVAPVIRRLKKEGHYLGAHSDKHLLYAAWENRDSLLIGQEEFRKDLRDNYSAMNAFGIEPKDASYFLPPYEWYNRTIAGWTQEFGITLMNFTPGTSSNADYTTPDMKNYVPSDSITARILRHERTSPNGLNGFILLSHIGTSELRKDKFYTKLDMLIRELKKRGYAFKRVP